MPLATRHLGAVGLFVAGIGVGLAQAIAGAGATATRIGGVLSLTMLFAVTASLLRRWLAPRRPRLATVLIVLWTVAYLVLTLAVPEAPVIHFF